MYFPANMLQKLCVASVVYVFEKYKKNNNNK